MPPKKLFKKGGGKKSGSKSRTKHGRGHSSETSSSDHEVSGDEVPPKAEESTTTTTTGGDASSGTTKKVFAPAVMRDLCEEDNIWGGLASDVPENLEGSAFAIAEIDYLRFHPVTSVIGALLLGMQENRRDVALVRFMLSTHLNPKWVFTWHIVNPGDRQDTYPVPGSLEGLLGTMLKPRVDGLAWITRKSLGDALAIAPRIMRLHQEAAEAEKIAVAKDAAAKTEGDEHPDQQAGGGGGAGAVQAAAPADTNDPDYIPADMLMGTDGLKPEQVAARATFGILPRGSVCGKHPNAIWCHAINGAMVGGFIDLVTVLLKVIPRLHIRGIGAIANLNNPLELAINLNNKNTPKYWELLRQHGIPFENRQRVDMLNLAGYEKHDYKMLRYLVEDVELSVELEPSAHRDENNILMSACIARKMPVLEYLWSKWSENGRKTFARHISKDGHNCLTASIVGAGSSSSSGFSGDTSKTEKSDTTDEEKIIRSLKFWYECPNAPVNQADDTDRGHTVLTVAVKNGFKSVVRFILEFDYVNCKVQGMEPLDVDKDISGGSATALTIAAGKGDLEMVQLLCGHKGITVEHQVRHAGGGGFGGGGANHQHTAMEVAVREDHVEILRYLHDVRDQSFSHCGVHVLILALDTKAWKCLEYLLSEQTKDPTHSDGAQCGNSATPVATNPAVDLRNHPTPASHPDDIMRAVELHIDDKVRMESRKQDQAKQLHNMIRLLASKGFYDLEKDTHKHVKNMLEVADKEEAKKNALMANNK